MGELRTAVSTSTSSSSSVPSEVSLAGDLFLVFLNTLRRKLDGDDPGGEAQAGIPPADPAVAANSALESSEPASLLSPSSELQVVNYSNIFVGISTQWEFSTSGGAKFPAQERFVIKCHAATVGSQSRSLAGMAIIGECLASEPPCARGDNLSLK